MLNDETFELRNVDPDDVSDVLAKVEKSFGFKFGDEDLKEVKTFGELCNVITGKVQGENGEDCTSQQAFYKLRHWVVETVCIKSDVITPNTDMQQLFPKRFRRKSIKAIERKLGFGLNLLRPKNWISDALVLLLLASIICVFIDWRIGLAGIIFHIVGSAVVTRFANEMPSQSLKQLVQKMTRENYRRVRRNPAMINRREIIEQVKTFFATDLALAPSVLHREATFD